MTCEFSEDIRAFLQEKRFLQNVSPKTILLYESSFKAFADALEPRQILGRVVELRERQASASTVNTYLHHLNCYYHWKDGKGGTSARPNAPTSGLAV